MPMSSVASFAACCIKKLALVCQKKNFLLQEFSDVNLTLLFTNNLKKRSRKHPTVDKLMPANPWYIRKPKVF